MSKPNLNHPALFTDEKLDATDFDHIQGDATASDSLSTDEADGLPMPTRTGQIVGGVLCVVSALLVVAIGWHLIARVLS